MSDPSLGLNDETKDVISLFNGTVLETHGRARCAGEFCCIHNPSDHPLRNAPMTWMRRTNLMMRICPHAHPHPDPDSVAYMSRAIPGFHYDGWHPCCDNGCCGVDDDC